MSNDLEEKRANFRQALQGLPSQFGQAAMHGAAAATVGAGVGMIGVAASKLYEAATKSRDFRSMLEANPDLADKHQQSPKKFNQMFTSLRSMNPEFSKDPLVAGEYMRRMSDDPLHAGGYLTDAVAQRDRFPSPLMDTYLKGGIEGLKGMGMGGRARSQGSSPQGGPPQHGGPRGAARQEMPPNEG